MGDTATTVDMPFSSVSVAEICAGEAPDGVAGDCVGFAAGAGAGDDAAAAGFAAGLPDDCAHAAGAPAASAAINVPASTRRQTTRGNHRSKREFVIGKSGRGNFEECRGSCQL
jgi:hypothetical protein